MLKVGLPDSYWSVAGSLAWLRGQAGIDAKGISTRVRAVLNGAVGK